MSEIQESGVYSIIAVQQQRPALPWAWAIGWAIAQAHPWIYHLLVDICLFGAAVCLYGTIVTLAPGAGVLGFLAAALSVLWPADPTRNDIATLGNRQALLFYALGVWLFVLAQRTGRTRYLPISSLALLISLLTYEAQLWLVAAVPLLMIPKEFRPNQRTIRLGIAAAWVPAFLWVLLDGAILFATRDHHTYQSTVSLDLAPLDIVSKLGEGMRVLFWDAWREPASLLSAGVVPDVGFVLVGVLLVVAFAGTLMIAERRHDLPPPRITRPLCIIGVIFSLLSLAVFVVTRIPVAQPDRTQTFGLTWAAVTYCAAIAWLVARLGPAWARPVKQGALVLGCLPAVVLFFAMVAVYQRNYRQTWEEQRSILTQIAQQAPDIEDGSLVVIGGLPDTRIVVPSGYTCEHALTWIEGHTPLPPGTVLGASSAEELTTQRINCGLVFNGRSLDPQVHLEFEQQAVLDTFPPYAFEFPYRSLLYFEYSADASLRLLGSVPAGLAPPGAPVSDYDPSTLIHQSRRNPRALDALS
jgi:hypothetical protein